MQKKTSTDSRLLNTALDVREQLRAVFVPELARIIAGMEPTEPLRVSLEKLRQLAAFHSQAIGQAVKDRQYSRRPDLDNLPAFSSFTSN